MSAINGRIPCRHHERYMSAFLIVFVGIVAGLVIGIVFGISICTSRHVAAGVPIRSTNRLIHLAARPTASYSFAGRILFMFIMLVWTCALFGGIGAPVIMARALGAETHPMIGMAIGVEFLIGFLSAFIAHHIWRKRVFSR